jgi:hypothetical protein
VNGSEICAASASTKVTVTTTAASAKASSCYIEKTAAVTAEWEGACIEKDGATKLATGAALLAAAYLMA